MQQLTPCTYTVTARDAAGNVSPVSESGTVTVSLSGSYTLKNVFTTKCLEANNRVLVEGSCTPLPQIWRFEPH